MMIAPWNYGASRGINDSRLETLGFRKYALDSGHIVYKWESKGPLMSRKSIGSYEKAEQIVKYYNTIFCSGTDEQRALAAYDLVEYETRTETRNKEPAQIVVEGAGNVAVNGVYENDGHFQGAVSYVMEGVWKGAEQKFHLFQCTVSNNTKHWYISIVPYGKDPGTSSDIDFYTVPAVGRPLPPSTGWDKTHEGLDPPPRVEVSGK